MPEARLLLLATGISALTVWSSLRAAQALFPSPPLAVTINAILAAVLAAVVIACLTQRAVRQRCLGWFERYSRWLQLDTIDAYLISVSPLLSLAAWTAAGLNRELLFPGVSIGLWAAALLAVVKVGLAERTHYNPEAGWDRFEIGYLAAVTLLALLARALFASQIPWLLTGDEGSMGLSAQEFLKGTWNSPFNTAWYSFPSLYFVLPAASIGLLGNTIFALRLPSAIAGALTVLCLYVYARRTFGRGPAMIASAVLAGFHFHIHFSRLALNNIWDGLFFVIFAGSLWSAWKSERTSAFVWPGLAMGISLYFYVTARMIPPILIAWLGVAQILDRAGLRRRLPGLVVLLLASLAAALPLVVYFLHNTPEFLAPMSRVGSLAGWLQDESLRTGTSPAWLLVDQLRLSTLAFFSVDLRHWYLPEIPMLMPLAATLFGLGCFLLVLRLRDLRYVFLALWLAAGIVAGALSESTPAAQRYVHLAPVVAVVIALPIVEALRLARRAWPERTVWAQRLAAVLVLAILLNDLYFYFGLYSSQTKYFGDNNTETANAVAQYLHDWPAGSDAYFIGGRMGYYSHATIAYLLPQIQGHEVLEPVSEATIEEVQGPTVFLALPERRQELAVIQAKYPGGVSLARRGASDEILFYSYELNPPD
ncbi:MAG TPA: glycosyltransferase family 39 protein [Anaerolineales bacterium]|jgi:4-amino-4-deoxy-L-arabinose transferase-like glycosyltransferase